MYLDKLPVEKLNKVKETISKVITGLNDLLAAKVNNNTKEYNKLYKGWDQLTVVKDKSIHYVIWGEDFELLKFLENSIVNMETCPVEFRKELFGVYADINIEILELFAGYTPDIFSSKYTVDIERWQIKVNEVLLKAHGVVVEEDTITIEEDEEGNEEMRSVDKYKKSQEQIEPDIGLQTMDVIDCDVLKEANPELHDEIKELQEEFNQTLVDGASNEAENNVQNGGEQMDHTQQHIQNHVDMVATHNEWNSQAIHQAAEAAEASSKEQAQNMNSALDGLMAAFKYKEVSIKKPSFVQEVATTVAVAAVTAAVCYAGIMIYDAVTSKDNGNGFL